MAGRVKIVGYAKKEYFGNGIEYRNFSPDLVGQQFASNEGTAIFTSGNFNITTNLDGKVDKNFVTNDFSNFLSLETLNLDDELEIILNKYSKKAKLNLDNTDTSTYAFFGSLREYIRVSLENVIIKWPASLYIRVTNASDNTLTGQTVTNYTYNSLTNSSTFEIDTNRIENYFDINYLSGGTIENTFNETNTLRNLVLNYGAYTISNTYGDFQITNLVGATGLTDSILTVTTTGNPFPNFGSENINYHVKPTERKREEFFFNLNDFENSLLNRLSIPEYTGAFKIYKETDTGDIVEVDKKLTWPVSDGYNIDFNSTSYSDYVNELLYIAENSDDLKSNLMVRFLVSSSISEFDTISDIEGSYPDANGQKMTNTLNIYGREFDEIKNYSDGISFANVVTYDKKNNTPDIIVKNLARVLGWELTSSITQIDVLSNFLNLNSNYYDGFSRGYSDAEAEVELWRRIILNTPWIWKSKGTRKAIEFLFKFIGAPDGLVTFNEHLYVAKESVDVDLITEMMDYFNDTTDISSLNVDSNGYPFIQPNNPDMYFQKAGLWYRTTGGPTPDIDILKGNNPHIGPYDGGQAFIDQFTSCLVPNFSGGTGEEVDVDAEINLFTNYGNGTFDECCDSDTLVVVDAGIDFDSILTTNLNKIYDNNPVTETGCTITNTWTLTASLTGETFHTYIFPTTSGTTAITEADYINELYNLSGTTELSGVTFVYVSGETLTIVASGDCGSGLTDTYFKIDLCVESTFNCIDETVTGLTAFNVSTTTDNACSPSGALPLLQTYYHNGTGVLPTTGDTVYSDSLGLSTVYHPSGSTVWMGGDWTDPTSWLQTDVNGLMTVIVCPEVVCLIEVGQDHTLAGNNSIDIFYIDGVSQLRTAQITFELFDIVKSDPASFVTTTITDGEGSVSISDTNTSVSVTRFVSPNGGVASGGLYDYDALITNNSTVASWKVRMTVTQILDECILNSNIEIMIFQNSNIITCEEYRITNNGGSLQGFNYLDCNGRVHFTTLGSGQSTDICGTFPNGLPSGFTQLFLGLC